MKKILPLVAGIICSFAAFNANAGVIMDQTPLVFETTEINQVLSVNQFDASLGTLTDIEIMLTGAAVSSASLTNNAMQAQMFTFSSDIDLLLLAPGANQILNIGLLAFGPGMINAGETVALGPVMPTDALTFNIAAADFGAWIGAGTVNANCLSAVSNTQSGGGGNISVAQDTTAGCGMKVTYSFDERQQVPTPAPIALLGLGMLGLGYLRKRA